VVVLYALAEMRNVGLLVVHLRKCDGKGGQLRLGLTRSQRGASVLAAVYSVIYALIQFLRIQAIQRIRY
jgi:hypothetical protein